MKTSMRHLPILAGVFLCVIVGGCGWASVAAGTNGKSTSTTSVESFRLVTRTPSPGGTGSSRGLVTLQFSDNVDSSSVVIDSLIVRSSFGDRVDGSMTVNGPNVEWRSGTPIQFGSSYSVKLSGDIRSDDGRVLPGPIEWSFNVSDGAWTEWRRVASLSQIAGLTVDEMGNATAVSIGRQGAITSVFGIRAESASSGEWGDPEVIFNFQGGAALDRRGIALLGTGDVAVTIATGEVFTSRVVDYAFTSGMWKPQGLNAGLAILPDPPRLAANRAAANPGLLAVWREAQNPPESIRAAALDADLQWSGIQVLNEGKPVGEPSVALNGNGGGLAIWREESAPGVANRLWYSRFDPVGGWIDAVPTLAETFSSPITATRVEGGQDTVAIALVALLNGQVQGMIYDERVDGWSPPTVLATVSDLIDFEVDTSGPFPTVFWAAPTEIGSRTFVPGPGWQISELVPLNGSDRVVEAAFGTDSQGRSICIWLQPDGSGLTDDFVQTSRKLPALPWSSAVGLGSPPGLTTLGDLRLSVSDHGMGVATWSTGTGVPGGDVQLAVSSWFE